MSELLALIGAIIALVVGVLSLVEISKKRKNKFKAIKEMIDEHFEDWKSVNYTFRGAPLIKSENFKKIKKFKKNLGKLKKEKLAFLLRNAVQYGLTGDWGDWLIINKNNEKIIDALIPTFRFDAGKRPAWRSAYILEKIFGNKIDQIYGSMSDDLKENEDVKFVFKIIKSDGVEKYLKTIIKKSNTDKLKEKAKAVLREIEIYSKQIESVQNN